MQPPISPQPEHLPFPEVTIDTRHSARGENQFPMVLNPNGPNSGTLGPIQLGFYARSIRIDNPTAQWWYVEHAHSYVRPYVLGVVLRIIPTQVAEIRAQTPPGTLIPASAQNANELGYAVFFDSELAPSPGILLGPQTNAIDALVNPGIAPSRLALGYVWNGATWDRAREALASDPVNLTGYPAISMHGNDSVKPVRWINIQNIGDAIGGTNTMSIGPWNYNGSAWDRVRTPNVFKTAVATAAGDTALWTPAASKKFRLMGGFLMLTGDAIRAARGDVEVLLRDGTTPTGIGASYYVDQVGPGTTITDPESLVPLTNMGNGLISAAANNVLNVNLSAALTTGEVRASVWGTEE